jgi:folylpolyglutamate synthase/dihydropteroate synthase
VLAVSSDKDAAGISSALVPLAGRVVLARGSSRRAADPRTLLETLPPTSAPVEVAESAAEALGIAMVSPRTPIVCVAGSLYFVGDVLTLLAGEPDKPCPIEKSADI